MEGDRSNSSEEASLRFLSPTLSASYQISPCFTFTKALYSLYISLSRRFLFNIEKQSIGFRVSKSFVIIIIIIIIIINILLTWKIVEVSKASVIYIYIDDI